MKKLLTVLLALRHFSWLVSLTQLQASTWLPRMADWLKNGCRGCFVGACVPAACAHKTTATAIFKPVSRPPISQWRTDDQPIPMA